MSLFKDSKARKDTPMATGVLDYFPDALAAVARLSKAGNDKHNPGQPLHWAKDKSTDHADCILRHMADRGTVDAETGELHDVAVAWRALAMLQVALEKQNAALKKDDVTWQPWGGGFSPVKADVRVILKFRDGSKSSSLLPAGCYRWSHIQAEDDIIKWRFA